MTTAAISASVGMPASIRCSGAGACATSPSHSRQAYLGRRVTHRAAGGLGLGASAWGANTHADGGFVTGCYIFQVTPTIGADSVMS